VTRYPDRSGHTLVEALVSIAILISLIGILLPAVQKARGTAARAGCANNLKQIGTALHNYHTATGKLPPGLTRQGWGWSAPLAPYLEQQGLADAMKLGPYNKNIAEANWGQPPPPHPLYKTPSLTHANPSARNVAAIETVVPVFQCPSMKTPKQMTDTYGVPSVPNIWSVERRCPATYIACVSGIWLSDSIADAQWKDGDGMFLRTSNEMCVLHTLASCTDGLSNTLFIGEAHPTPPVPGAPLERTSPANAPAHKDHWYFGSDAARWGYDFSEMLGTTAVPPNYTAADDGVAELAKVEFGFSSPHFGGVQGLFGDGSVRFVPSGIDPTVWSLVGQRADGESIASPD
jgi:type II secretory pathway pseudopilin PulG